MSILEIFDLERCVIESQSDQKFTLLLPPPQKFVSKRGDGAGRHRSCMKIEDLATFRENHRKATGLMIACDESAQWSGGARARGDAAREVANLIIKSSFAILE